MSSVTYLDTRLNCSNPDMVFESLDGTPADIETITLNDKGYIESITTFEGKELYPEEFKFHNNLLEVPGIGYLTPGTRIVYEDKDYILNYGWHTNISNQCIYTWYLESADGAPPKTVYKEMIDKINIFHYR